MSKEMPEWFIDYLEEHTGFSRPGKSEAVIDFYNFISKPENAAKIPAVKSLVNSMRTIANKKVCEAMYGADFPKFNSYASAYDDISIYANSALKPFRKEGSDGI